MDIHIHGKPGLRTGVFTCVGWQVTLCDCMASDTPQKDLQPSFIKNQRWWWRNAHTSTNKYKIRTYYGSDTTCASQTTL